MNPPTTVCVTNIPVELLRLATEDCYGREFLDYKMAIKP